MFQNITELFKLSEIEIDRLISAANDEEKRLLLVIRNFQKAEVSYHIPPEPENENVQIGRKELTKLVNEGYFPAKLLKLYIDEGRAVIVEANFDLVYEEYQELYQLTGNKEMKEVIDDFDNYLQKQKGFYDEKLREARIRKLSQDYNITSFNSYDEE